MRRSLSRRSDCGFSTNSTPAIRLYHIARALRLRGKLERAALDRAMDEIIRRHEILRTTFPCIEDRPVQRVASRLATQPAIIDLRGTARAQRRAEMLRALAELSAERFDLRRGPLIRAHLLQLGARDHVLLLVLHQIICDGWSMSLLLRELAALYGAALLGKATPLPAPAMQYRDYARRQRQDSRKADLKEQLAYWRARLQGSASGIALPTDRARPALQSFSGGRLPLSIPKPLVERLKALGRRRAPRRSWFSWRLSTRFCCAIRSRKIFPSAFPRPTGTATPARYRTVRQYAGAADGSVGRSDFRALLRRVREQCRGALAHRDLPFDRLVDEIERQRDLSRNPLFQVMFAYQNYAPAQFAAPGLRATPLDPAAPPRSSISRSRSASMARGWTDFSNTPPIFSSGRRSRAWRVISSLFYAAPRRGPSAAGKNSAAGEGRAAPGTH